MEEPSGNKDLVVPHGSALPNRNGHERIGWVTDHNCRKVLFTGEKSVFPVVSTTQAHCRAALPDHAFILWVKTLWI